MSLTLISHFWNEEFLLPYWLAHHYPLFDHGILIDYASTDRSLEIIRDLAPSWEVRSSRNKWFGAREVDQEVMEVERECAGWKMVLNTTVFLMTPDLRQFVDSVEQTQPDCHGIWPFDLTMVDPLAHRNDDLSLEPLWLQKRWGYHSGGSRSRLLHRCEDGKYAAGRHSSNAVTKALDNRFFILWFGWCPLRFVKNRKLQIQQRVPPWDRADGLSHHHIVSPEQLEAAYQQEASKTNDLWEALPGYRCVVEELCKLLTR